MNARIALFALVMALPFATRATAADTSVDVGHRGHTGAEVVVAWNERILAIAQAEDQLLTLKGVRTATMAHLAIHNALNAIRPRYASYGTPPAGTPGADPLAAAAQAAYDVASNQYPDKDGELRAELEKWLSQSRPGRPRDRGVALGKQAAHDILVRRRDDGWDREGTYEWRPPGPGVYADFHEHSGTPPGFVFGTGYPAVTPFTLTRADQFRAPPPPPVTSAGYAAAYNEVKEFGRVNSPSRSADQTHLALWWKDFAESSHNRLVRELVTTERTGLWDAARLFALVNMSILDAYINVWENKFFYNHWRPYTAIRWAGDDGNPATASDPQWQNTHRHTYPFPSYPSAHGTACAAAMTVIADTFGDEYQFTMTTPMVDEGGPMSPKIPMNPPTRSFDSFSSAAMECALSRVYLGIHFRYDSEAGNRLGTQIGRNAAQQFLYCTHCRD